MRIVGEIEHAYLKITLFKNDGRFSAKFEDGLIEQIFKFREDTRLASVEDFRQIINAEFIEKAEKLMAQMADMRFESLNAFLAQHETDNFDVII